MTKDANGWQLIGRTFRGECSAMTGVSAIFELQRFFNLIEEEFVGEVCRDEPDDESISTSTEGPCPITFGHIRRAQMSVAVLASLLTEPKYVFEQGFVYRRSLGDVARERARQIRRRFDGGKGFSDVDDDKYARGELLGAASCYVWAARLGEDNIALANQRKAGSAPDGWRGYHFFGVNWPWARDWWKPTTVRRCLVKAAALILAEIDRIDRKAEKGGAA